MADDEQKKEGGFLSKAFRKTAKWAAIGILFNIPAGFLIEFIKEPVFFKHLHKDSNEDVTAWMGYVEDHTRIVTDLLGITSDWGFLKLDFIQSLIAPYKQSAVNKVAGSYGNANNNSEDPSETTDIIEDTDVAPVTDAMSSLTGSSFNPSMFAPS